MLARTMKTAAELGIGEDIYDALIEVRDALRSGRLPHVYIDGPCPPLREFDKFGFNMRSWGECGSVKCIGGWVHMLCGGKRAEHDTPNLQPLYYPKGISIPRWSDITPLQAADAIDNYLHTGRPQWRSVMLDVKVR